MKIVGIIPARLQSSRLPRKLLLNATGKPLIQYVWETACQCPELHDVVIATDSEEIASVVESFGGRVEMTREHNSGTDRIAEVTRRCFPDADAIINLQGDEPELDPRVVTSLVHELKSSDSQMATVASPITSPDVVRDPGCVKVVTDVNGRAMYFSRAPIPFSRDLPIEEFFRDGEPSPWLLHVGLYAYRRAFLLKLTSMPPSPLEQLEKLEQLRALQCGASIAVAVVNHAAAGIDTPEDYAAFVQRQVQRQTQRRRVA
ncbi:MAG TPA: 3-deoxy-manno-octulosonate cytidylyltransferase [Planctomycetaceae bacterium]|nr:3-deoxy-manno-octulosonate cytidylyltransferase [Planctomycetaceae bacterium]